MGIILALLTAFSLSVASSRQPEKEPNSGQNSQSQILAKKQVVELPLPKRGFRPKITLQEALKLAESYIKKEKIDTSSYYLREVRMIQYGGEKDVKEPRWFFLWAHENGLIGNYIEITVSLKGKVERHPSM